MKTTAARDAKGMNSISGVINNSAMNIIPPVMMLLKPVLTSAWYIMEDLKIKITKHKTHASKDKRFT